MKRLLAILIFLPLMVNAQIKKPLTVDNLWAMKRIGSFEVSPNGKKVTYLIDNQIHTGNLNWFNKYKK